MRQSDNVPEYLVKEKDVKLKREDRQKSHSESTQEVQHLTNNNFIRRN